MIKPTRVMARAVNNEIAYLEGRSTPAIIYEFNGTKYLVAQSDNDEIYKVNYPEKGNNSTIQARRVSENLAEKVKRSFTHK